MALRPLEPESSASANSATSASGLTRLQLKSSEWRNGMVHALSIASAQSLYKSPDLCGIISGAFLLATVLESSASLIGGEARRILHGLKLSTAAGVCKGSADREIEHIFTKRRAPEPGFRAQPATEFFLIWGLMMHRISAAD
jgi:hypothetical protein